MPALKHLMDSSFNTSVFSSYPEAAVTTDNTKDRDKVGNSVKNNNFALYSSPASSDFRSDASVRKKPKVPIYGPLGTPSVLPENDVVWQWLSATKGEKHNEELVFDRAVQKQQRNCKKSVLEFLLDNNFKNTAAVLLHNGEKLAFFILKDKKKWGFRNCLFETQPKKMFDNLEELVYFLDMHWQRSHLLTNNEQKQRPMRFRKKRENRVQREKAEVYGTVFLKASANNTAKIYKKIMHVRQDNENSRWLGGFLHYRHVEEVSKNIVSVTKTYAY